MIVVSPPGKGGVSIPGRIVSNGPVHSTLPPPDASVEWRCAGCGSRIRGDAQRLPAFCPFCMAWAQWRQRGDELWAQAISGQKDHSRGMTSLVHPSA
jgi:hypothetical protein